MILPRPKPETHRINRSGWLRAVVLGANDGIISTASLLVGVSTAGLEQVLMTGIAGLAAGAMSMAAGEYVSVYSQADIESADLRKERLEQQNFPAAELRELADIYVKRGVTRKLALQIAKQLMQHDALGAHARDELGISSVLTARPLQAALASAASFTIGASLPLMVTLFTPAPVLLPWLTGTTLIFLGILGAIAAQIGNASKLRGAWRVILWGAIAMAITAAVGRLFTTKI
ncbi:VIT family protein [Methylomonas sp. AM2-LC]|uniref:VIT1/CCC1 transporter family protein n=1 Tax=Methylomonas sp. AM2-LC TaxID=3153301 RepID=UPI0032674E72